MLPKKDKMNVQGRVPEFTGEIPLLKKVLLMKIMEDKNTTDAASSAAEKDNQKSNDASNGCKKLNEQKNENNSTAPTTEMDSEKVYLEQFSRTLGFHMSQLSEDLVPAPKPQPRARLNALSLTPSPSKENITTADSVKQMEQEVTPVKKESKKKSAQTQVRKGRLSRMMAVREDSDENSAGDDDEDPFVKSTEVQTDDMDHLRTLLSPTEFSYGGEQRVKGAKLEDGIQDYLVKMMHNMKLAMKAYVVEQQIELQKRISQLETDTKKKDELIKHLRSQLKLQYSRASSTFDEVSSLDPSSLSVSEADDDSVCASLEPERGGDEDQDEDEDRDLNDEEIRILQEKLKTQRKSWPTSVNIRRRKISNKKSYSLDEEQQPVNISPNSDELWRLEFPPRSPDVMKKVSSFPPKIIPTIPERLVEESSLPESEEDDQVSDRLPAETRQTTVSGNDWEVRMLVQQFDKNQREQRRRHSSGEALTWDKVLHLRNVALIRDQGPESGRHSNSSSRHNRRKYSLVEEGTLRQWAASSMVQSSSHTSLTDAKGSHRTFIKSPRRKSYGTQKHFEPPSSRKNSLPVLPHCSSIGMSRWLSMDDAKSEGCLSQDSSLHTTPSSAYSQETVIGIETRFSSIDDVRHERGAHLGIRSPSSPNVVTDRDCTTSFEYATASGSHLPEWPSSPCLPTISEDEQSHVVLIPSSTSTGRSSSLTTLPSGDQPNEFSNSTQSLQFTRNFTGASCRRRASADFGLQHQARASSTPDNLFPGQFRVSNSLLMARGASNNNIVDTEHPSSQSSVAISIPEYEPLLSP